MVRVPRPILWWSSEDDGKGLISSALTNKLVWLNGSNVRQHTPFQIRKRNLLQRIPGLGQRLFSGWIGDMPTVNLGNGEMRSSTYWHAPSVSLAPKYIKYFFVDGNGGVSGTLAVANAVTSLWTSVRHGGAGLSPKVSGNLSLNGFANGHARAKLFDAHREYELTVGIDLIAPRDPTVEITILEPGTSRDLLYETALNVLNQEVAGLNRVSPEELSIEALPMDDRYIRYVGPALRHIDTFLGRRYVDFRINGPNRITVSPEEPSPISLTIRGDGPNRFLFAIQVLDLNTMETTISEFMPVVVTQTRSD